MRLFVALPVSDTVRRALAELQGALSSQLPDLQASWPPPENAHLTLVFLGEIAERDLPYCRQALAAATRRPPLSLVTTQPGAFPSRSRPSVLWLGVTDGDRSGALSALQSDVAARLSVLRRGEEARAFRPHLTAGRLRRSLGAHDELMEALERLAPAPLSWEVGEVVLYRSRRTPRGPVHTAVHREVLRATANREPE